MSCVDDLVKKAQKFKAKGLSDTEIAEELNIQVDTVVWLLQREVGKKEVKFPADYAIDWSNVGSSSRRLSLFGWALADLAKEALERKEFEAFDVVVGVDLSGAPMGLMVADELGKPFTIVRFPRRDEKGKQIVPVIVTSYSYPLKGKKILLVNDVISTGIILRTVIKYFKEQKVTPVGMVVIADKRGGGKLDNVKVKALINMTSFKR